MKGVIIFLASIIFLGGNLYVFIPSIMRSYNKLEKLDRQGRDLDSKIIYYKQEITAYEDKIEKMKDEFYREKMGRDKHKLVKEGETVYKPIIK